MSRGGKSQRFVGVEEVRLDDGRTVWHAAIDLGRGYPVFLGRFSSARDAAAAYDARCVEEGMTPANGTRMAVRAAALKKAVGLNGIRGGSSLYAGVSFHAGVGKWQTKISMERVDGTGLKKQKHLGFFADERLAAAAYDAKLRELGRPPTNGTSLEEQEAVPMVSRRHRRGAEELNGSGAAGGAGGGADGASPKADAVEQSSRQRNKLATMRDGGEGSSYLVTPLSDVAGHVGGGDALDTLATHAARRLLAAGSPASAGSSAPSRLNGKSRPVRRGFGDVGAQTRQQNLHRAKRRRREPSTRETPRSVP